MKLGQKKRAQKKTNHDKIGQSKWNGNSSNDRPYCHYHNKRSDHRMIEIRAQFIIIMNTFFSIIFIRLPFYLCFGLRHSTSFKSKHKIILSFFLSVNLCLHPFWVYSVDEERFILSSRSIQFHPFNIEHCNSSRMKFLSFYGFPLIHSLHQLNSFPFVRQFIKCKWVINR